MQLEFHVTVAPRSEGRNRRNEPGRKSSWYALAFYTLKLAARREILAAFSSDSIILKMEIPSDILGGSPVTRST